MRRATVKLFRQNYECFDFYPRSPCGERRILPHHSGKIIQFLSTLSLRRATLGNVVAGLRTSFLSTLSLRRATHGCYSLRHSAQFLSTLSLRRATINGLRHKCASFYFYPRSPCGERRIMTIIICIALRFLSTLSLRRATTGIFLYLTFHENFYPRSPCGERPDIRPLNLSSISISIHALLAESDCPL